MGLVVCKQLCELMRGHLTVDSEPGKGSTFVFKTTFAIAAGAENFALAITTNTAVADRFRQK